MPDISLTDAAGADGALPKINYGGKVYEVAPATPKAAQRVEEELCSAAWANAERMRGKLPAAAFAELKASVTTDISLNRFAFGGPLFTAALDGPDAFPLILFGCLGEKHKDITLADVKGMFRESPSQVEYALLRCGPDFFSQAAGTMAAPEAERAALAAGLSKWLTETVTRVQEQRAKTAG